MAAAAAIAGIGSVAVRQIRQGAACVGLALSVAVAHERHKRLDGARRGDRRLDGIVAGRQLRQGAGCIGLASSVAAEHERHKRLDGVRRGDCRRICVASMFRHVPFIDSGNNETRL